MTPPTTVERKILSKVLRQGFLGVAYDDTTYCPVSIPGVDFSASESDAVTPFTPEQVRDSVGYVELTLREIDSRQSGVTSGIDDLGSGDVMVSTIEALTRCRFEIRVPTKSGSGEATVETYEERIKELFLGLRVTHAGPPIVRFRQNAHLNPPRVWADYDEGDWRVRTVDFLVQRRERRPQAGLTEVSIS